MKVLLIGAGAVGQVYGYHFQRGGADVSFFVREKYAAEVREGFNLYPLNRKNARAAPVRLDGFGVLTDMDEVGAQTWDAVVLCLSSTALRKGSWLADLAAVLGDATLVNLTPGIEDFELISRLVPIGQIVSGLIGISSYPGPLGDEGLPAPGMVYWVPPMTKMAFSGLKLRTMAVVDALNAGGLKSKRTDDVNVTVAFGASLLQFQIIGLELTGWKFRNLRGDKALMRRLHQATRQAFTIASRRVGKPTPFGMRLVRPWIMRLVMRIASRAAPFNIELFFQKHFLKVGDQTEHHLGTLLALADKYDVPSDAIAELRDRLVAHRAP